MLDGLNEATRYASTTPGAAPHAQATATAAAAPATGFQALSSAERASSNSAAAATTAAVQPQLRRPSPLRSHSPASGSGTGSASTDPRLATLHQTDQPVAHAYRLSASTASPADATGSPSSLSAASLGSSSLYASAAPADDGLVGSLAAKLRRFEGLVRRASPAELATAAVGVAGGALVVRHTQGEVAYAGAGLIAQNAGEWRWRCCRGNCQLECALQLVWAANLRRWWIWSRTWRRAHPLQLPLPAPAAATAVTAFRWKRVLPVLQAACLPTCRFVLCFLMLTECR